MKIAPMVDKVLCFDVYQDNEWIKTVPNAEYVDMDTLLRNSHFITIHVPLLPQTHHLLNKDAFDKMKQVQFNNYLIIISTKTKA